MMKSIMKILVCMFFGFISVSAHTAEVGKNEFAAIFEAAHIGVQSQAEILIGQGEMLEEERLRNYLLSLMNILLVQNKSEVVVRLKNRDFCKIKANFDLIAESYVGVSKSEQPGTGFNLELLFDGPKKIFKVLNRDCSAGGGLKRRHGN